MSIDNLLKNLSDSHTYKMIESSNKSFEDRCLLSSNLRNLNRNEVLKIFQLYDFKDRHGNLLANCSHFIELLDLIYE